MAEDPNNPETDEHDCVPESNSAWWSFLFGSNMSWYLMARMGTFGKKGEKAADQWDQTMAPILGIIFVLLVTALFGYGVYSLFL